MESKAMKLIHQLGHKRGFRGLLHVEVDQVILGIWGVTGVHVGSIAEGRHQSVALDILEKLNKAARATLGGG